jgi:hypothetical protein
VRRLLLIVTSVAVLLAILAPTALAAGPVTTTGSVAVSVNGTLDLPADASVDSVIVVDGTATIRGDARTVVVIDGTATLDGASVHDLVVVSGRADLLPGTTVHDVATWRSTVTQDPAAAITGRTTAFETDLAALALLLIPVMIAFTIGLALAAVVAAVAVAVFGARQVREAEAQITTRPGHALVAGIAGSILLPLVGGLLVVSVIGAPVGLALLLGVLPVLAFVGWIVAAIWVGEWLLARAAGAPETGRPVKAAILGVIVLSIAGMLPFVSAIATLFGFGALLLVAWRIIRPEQPVAPAQPAMGPMTAAPTAG